MDTFQQRNTIRFTTQFKDASGDLIDPAGVVFVVKKGRVETTYVYGIDEIVRSELGVYYLDVYVDKYTGLLTVLCKSTGSSPPPAGVETTVMIDSSRIQA